MKKILVLTGAMAIIAAAIIMEIPLNESLDIRCTGELVITPDVGLDIDRVVCVEPNQSETEIPALTATNTAVPTQAATATTVASTPTTMPTLAASPTPVATQITSSSGDRPRVVVQNGTVVTGDTNVLLRCDAPRSDDAASRNSQAWWDELRDDYHLNCVRIFARVVNGNEPASVHRADIQAWVDAAGEQGFYAIIDYHLNPPGTQIDFNATRAWWSVIAADHKDRTHVLFELVNEPPGGLAMKQFQLWLWQDVRAVAPDTHVIFFSTKDLYTSTLNTVRNTIDTYLTSVPFTNESIGFHAYWSGDSIQNLDVLKNWDEPIFNTEVGSLSINPDDETEIARYELENISWMSLDGFMDDRIPSSYVTWAIDPYFE